MLSQKAILDESLRSLCVSEKSPLLKSLLTSCSNVQSKFCREGPPWRPPLELTHIGMRDGNLIVKVEILNDEGQKVVEGTAEVAQPTTLYVFTGQDLKSLGCAWSSITALQLPVLSGTMLMHCIRLVDIVKNNPMSKTVHFGGIKGQAIRQRYMYMTFAGHSLGGHSALASIAGVLPISSLVDVVFYRGITMQRTMERDAQNRSNYAMCAVNPSRISKTFNNAALREVVDTVSTKGNVLLENVNFNVEEGYISCDAMRLY
jgi:hypothetical protein